MKRLLILVSFLMGFSFASSLMAITCEELENAEGLSGVYLRDRWSDEYAKCKVSKVRQWYSSLEDQLKNSYNFYFLFLENAKYRERNKKLASIKFKLGLLPFMNPSMVSYFLNNNGPTHISVNGEIITTDYVCGLPDPVKKIEVEAPVSSDHESKSKYVNK